MHDAALRYGDDIEAITDLAGLQGEILKIQIPTRNVDHRHHHRRMIRPRRWVAAAATLTALGAGAFGIGTAVGGGSETPVSPPAAAAPAEPGPQAPDAAAPKESPRDPAFDNQEEQTRADLDTIAKDKAEKILDDLDNPKAGTENYDRTRIGNKKAIVGKDFEMNTPDDAKYKGVPEMFVNVDLDSKTVLVRSVSMHGPDSNPTFLSESHLFTVGPDNPLLKDTDQFTTEQVRALLADPGTRVKATAVDNEEDNSYGVYVDAQGHLVVATGLDARMLVDNASVGTPPLVPANPNLVPGVTDRLHQITTSDELNEAVDQIKTISDAVSAQLTKDTNGGNR